MNTSNLERLPINAQKALKVFIDDLVKIHGEDIVSITVHGSVTGPDYNPKTSDINILVVLNDTSLEKLKPSLKAVRAGLRKKITAPLFLTPSYIKKSLDTFPMEFMSMKDSRLVLLGEDILADIDVNKEDLRRECEHQLKGKLITIRQAFLEQALSRKKLEKLIKTSLRALMPVFQGILRVKEGGTPSKAKEEILLSLREKLDIDTTSFLEVLRDEKSDGQIGGKDAETFLNDFLIQLERLSSIVDEM